jgi:hypothetical protein
MNRQFTAVCGLNPFEPFIGRENRAEMIDNRRLPKQHLSIFTSTEQIT